MDPVIRTYDEHDQAALIDLSLRAWAPVFASLESVLGEAGGYAQQHPDWRTDQQRVVEAACRSESISVWVAEVDTSVVGFVAVQLDHPEPSMGEIHMMAVDPDHQRSGVGAMLTSFALERIAGAGMAVATVETGGDPGHAPARSVYEQAGFVQLPISRYFKKL